jgi:hypothetical protein
MWKIHIDTRWWEVKVLSADSYRDIITWTWEDSFRFFDYWWTNTWLQSNKQQRADEEWHKHFQRWRSWIPYINDWIIYEVWPPKYPPTQSMLNRQIKEWKDNWIEVLDFSFRKK